MLLKETRLFVFTHFLEYLLLFLDNNVDEESKTFSNVKSLVSRCYLAFACFLANFRLVLLVTVFLIKEAFIRESDSFT